MSDPIGMDWKGYKLIRYWTHYMTLTFDLTHDPDVGFWNSNFEIVLFKEWMGPDLFERFAETNKKINLEAVYGDMGKNKYIYVFFFQF